MPGVSEERLAEILAERSQLSDDELLAFLTILLVAGNETTRNGISGGLLALSRFPAEQQRLVDHIDDDVFVDRAIEELLRYVSPVHRLHPHGHPDPRLQGHRAARGRPRADALPVGQPGRAGVRPPRRADPRPRPEPAPCVRDRPALSAWAPTSPARSSRSCSRSCCAGFPTSRVPEGALVPRGASTLVLALQHVPAGPVPGRGLTMPTRSGAAARVEPARAHPRHRARPHGRARRVGHVDAQARERVQPQRRRAVPLLPVEGRPAAVGDRGAAVRPAHAGASRHSTRRCRRVSASSR